jgi:hypothetical protein
VAESYDDDCIRSARAVGGGCGARASSEPAVHALAADLPSIGRFVTRIAKRATVRCCGEAGPCGFSLHRFLTRAGIACDVIAPPLGDPGQERRARSVTGVQGFHTALRTVGAEVPNRGLERLATRD